MKISNHFVLFAIIAAFGMICAKQAAARSLMTLTAVGSGEKARLAIDGKKKIIMLKGTEIGEFTAAGEPSHRYTTLLSIRKNNAFYIVAKLMSGAAISDPNASCGGDRPKTLLLIKTDKSLKIENVQTEIYESCAYNGVGRYIKGKPQITKNKVSIAFDEGSKKYTLLFDANEADKGLQLINR